jgi:RNA polymerase sigma-70 factor (ECF subfamily)
VFDDELVGRLADEAASAGQRHEAQREALEDCLQKLPTPQRALVLAAYTKGTRMDELAAQRGQTAMSLYKLLQRIRQALLECVRRTIAREQFT